VREMIRCGRANCKCASGSLHGPYYYRVWMAQGVRYKSYVKKADLERTNAGIEAFRAQRRYQRRQGDELLSLLRMLRREQRDRFNSMLNGGL
jgi:hypothetical protein